MENSWDLVFLFRFRLLCRQTGSSGPLR